MVATVCDSILRFAPPLASPGVRSVGAAEKVAEEQVLRLDACNPPNRDAHGQFTRHFPFAIANGLTSRVRTLLKTARQTLYKSIAELALPIKKIRGFVRSYVQRSR
jgi:hypothetical protein